MDMKPIVYEDRKTYVLTPEQVAPIRTVDERLVSYNIEMTEVTGGTFWKAYTPGQIEGTEEFKFSGELSDIAEIPELMPEKQKAGIVSFAPGSCTFLVL